ncbi:PREDICTED: flocculation protein FLO11 [Nicrophorus vespilloides]|uniref:Flocculation protein FLO11 n=1 Tax=Nicrophorus vespilloides TaxID=110193 RepID=A0ABM1N852_NICVS|nr:PREDICTED: flocculation protein FLO11 [Nicrophorus vespilloides]
MRLARSTMKAPLFAAVVATIVLTASSRAVNISNTWMLPEEGFPVFYRYFRDRISWNEADAVCQFHHANLVTVDTTSQYDAIRAYLKELDIADNVWIGLSRGSDTTNFTWRDFRALSLTDYWQEAIPTGNEALCATMDPAADFRWHALPCGGPAIASFICELPVPSWANGPKGCLLTELPSLTVLFIPEQSAVELTSDCGLGGTKRIACKGNTDRDEIMKRLACNEGVVDEAMDDDEERAESPAPTAINQDPTYGSTNGAHVSNTRTTKPWIWTSNTIDTGDYGLPTRHRRETEEDTMVPSSTLSSATEKISPRIEVLTAAPSTPTPNPQTPTTIPTPTPNPTPSPTDLSSSTAPELETTSTEQGTDEYPSAINQGQLFSIIENGTIFDIIELNGTEENRTVSMEDIRQQTTVPSDPPATYTTVIYHKEPTEESPVTSSHKIPKTTNKARSSLNAIPSQSPQKTLSKEIEMFPIVGNSYIKLNRTNRKELPNYGDNMVIPSVHKTVEIRIHEPGKLNVTKSAFLVTTKKAPKTMKPQEPTASVDVQTTTRAQESFDSEPTAKPNRQRQLTRPQRRSFYPYFFSRVLG